MGRWKRRKKKDRKRQEVKAEEEKKALCIYLSMKRRRTGRAGLSRDGGGGGWDRMWLMHALKHAFAFTCLLLPTPLPSHGTAKQQPLLSSVSCGKGGKGRKRMSCVWHAFFSLLQAAAATFSV